MQVQGGGGGDGGSGDGGSGEGGGVGGEGGEGGEGGAGGGGGESGGRLAVRSGTTTPQTVPHDMSVPAVQRGVASSTPRVTPRAGTAIAAAASAFHRQPAAVQPCSSPTAAQSTPLDGVRRLAPSPPAAAALPPPLPPPLSRKRSCAANPLVTPTHHASAKPCTKACSFLAITSIARTATRRAGRPRRRSPGCCCR